MPNGTKERLAGPNPDIRGLRGLVIGMGVSGQAAAELLLSQGAQVSVYDRNTDPLNVLRSDLESRGVTVHAGALPVMDDLDFCVISPGVSPAEPALQWIYERKIPVTGELELACRFIQRPIVAVTGTNGKTTVVNMIHHVLKACGYKPDLVGNVGTAVSELVCLDKRQGDAPVVLEISSFQCETMEEFKPAVGVLTNLAPDHLDRYNSPEEYYTAKFLMAKNLTPNEALWIGPGVEGHIPNWVQCKTPGIALDVFPVEGICYAQGCIAMRDEPGGEPVHPYPHFDNYLPQQRLNGLAAIGACYSLGVPMMDILAALETFVPLPHRLELVKEVNGIRCYNDSKATNVHAMEAALHSVPAPILLIAGGRAKGEWTLPDEQLVREKVKAAYLIGETAEIFAQAWQPMIDVHLEPSLESAVRNALRSGKNGDALLLSPGCASWDMFKNYAERGDRFRKAVEEYQP